MEQLTINKLQNKKITCESADSCLGHKHGNVTCLRRGTSLLELLIYVAILSGLMVVVSDAFIMLSKGRGQAEARSEVNSAIRFAGELIKQDVKNASAVSTPILGTPASTLSLSVGGNTILYDMSAGVLRRKVNAGTPELITGTAVSVDVPTFTRLENYNTVLLATTTAIQVSMTMRYNASSTDWVYSDSLRTTTTFR
jgi:type II secretory pathway pseudopilin PulG